ncbi:zf-HC2 domain-containing protein [Spongiactinospora sp. TRM90649]|uniref:anti-sigma factor family protein n=1 Tax=Spongiactinospora sp. TRM90649 TaxID=3031114 RepID=UPI0023F95B4F|nr:zf-HC2 domain-containing protein [Spongiactinospora sp. TRM90649]MDF5756154.1 zf-HC2 domain-containing protein [Spongiactinospora sp. TRM90649]
MTGDTHYDLEILAELAEGLLDDAEARPVREHLAVCDPCGESLADLAAVREVLAATPTPAMPMGVALRIDQALAAEAGRTGRAGTAVAVAEAPDWERLMADAPWETVGAGATGPARIEPAETSAPEIAEPEPVRLGVVADDGTVVPARRRERTSRRRRWALPATAAVAAAAVVGSVALSTSLISASGGQQEAPPVTVAESPVQPKVELRLAYKITNSDFNYSNRDLRGSLSDYFAPAVVLSGPESVKDKLLRCIGGVSDKLGQDPFQVDQGYYEGQEAALMLFWKNREANKVQVRVVDPECKNLRKPALAKW